MAKKQAEKKVVETVVAKKVAAAPQVEVKNPVAKDVFLATIGFYGKAFDDLSALIKELNAKREEQFKDFVARGADVESRIKNKIEAFRNEDNKINAGIASLRESYTKLAETLKLNKTEA